MSELDLQHMGHISSTSVGRIYSLNSAGNVIAVFTLQVEGIQSCASLFYVLLLLQQFEFHFNSECL